MAAVNEFVVAIELGSTKIKGIAGRHKADGRIEVLAYVTEDASLCIRKGVVYNIDKTAQCIGNIVQRLRSKLHAGIKQVYVGVGGQSIHSEINTIVRDLNGDMPVKQSLVVEMDDENRLMEYPGKEILDVESLEYRADSQLSIDAVGILCSRLEGNYLNILQSKRHYQNLNRCFNIAGVNIAEVYLAPFALADAVLTPQEKRGCILVDLGADTTTVIVYYKNIVRHIAVIPLGGNNITKDLCTLKIDEQDAEKLKRRYASAYTAPENIVPTQQYEIDSERKIASTEFIDIIEGRVQEIVLNVWAQILPLDFANNLIGGFVLTGGGANLRNIDRAFREYTSVEKVRVAKFVTYTINSNDSEINGHDGTHNTLLGLLAKGDQNCYQKEEPQAPTDLFAQGADADAQATDGLQRNAEDLSSHVVQTAAQKAAEAAKQKAAMEAAAAEAAAEIARKEAEQKAREEEEHRKREEEEHRKKKPTWKSKFTSWLGDIMTPDE